LDEYFVIVVFLALTLLSVIRWATASKFGQMSKVVLLGFLMAERS
jgi:hypothetical protein